MCRKGEAMKRFAILLAAGALSACAAQEGPVAGCDLGDPVLTASSFVIAKSPKAGDRVQSGFAVSGCSRTFESNVIWRLLAKDGSGYPIIMMSTRFAWAWEYVGEALGKTDLKISDRDREVGIYYLRVPERYTLGAKSAQLKLSHTTNGIQVAVLNEEGTALVEKTPGQAILERIFDELN